MGSFNIACGLSGLPITEGDRAAFIPLSSSKHKVEPIGPTFTDQCQFYAPVLPPVVGTYDGYGRIKGIELSAATQLIERAMNRSVDTALEAFTDGRRLYDKLGEGFTTYVTKPGLLTEYNVTTRSMLESLGFAGEGEEFLHPAGDAVVFQAGYAHHVRSRRGRITHLADSSIEEILNVFGTATGIYPGVADEDQDAVHVASSTTGMFAHPDMLAGMAMTISGDFVYERAAKIVKTNWDDLRERFARIDPAHPEHDKFQVFPSSWFDNDLVDALSKYTAWEPEQYGYLEHLDQDSVLSMMQVVDVASALGRTLGPTQYLSEVDSVEYAQAAHRIAGEILERRSR